MWRNDVGNNAQENHDSEQSISEEEEGLDGEWTGKTISLGGGENNMVLISQQIKAGYHIEDEVEIPIFNDGDRPNHLHKAAAAAHPDTNEGMIYLPAVASILYSDEDIISDDEVWLLVLNFYRNLWRLEPLKAVILFRYSLFLNVKWQHIQKTSPPSPGIAIENLGGTWSQAGREVEALARSNEKASCSSHHDVFLSEKKSSRGRGGRKKAKPRFSFPLHSHKKEMSLAVSDSKGRTLSDNMTVVNEIDVAADDDMDNDMAESQLNFHDKETEQPGNHIVPFELAHNHDTRGHSMAEVLNCFLDRSEQQGSSEVETQKNRSRAYKISERSSSPLDDVILDNDDLPEALDSDTPFESEDDEENAKRLKSSIPGTLVDQFHEAFGTASLNEDMLHVAFPRPLCSGLYSKLQQVMQSEKEKDMHFPKNASVETSFKDDGMSILLRILSRSLEAKLIVCSCSSVGIGKNSENNLEMKMNGISRTLTVIFNPRMCSNVDLEVGNLICVRPPWKEVQVKDEIIYLCSYFVQVQP